MGKKMPWSKNHGIEKSIIEVNNYYNATEVFIRYSVWAAILLFLTLILICSTSLSTKVYMIYNILFVCNVNHIRDYSGCVILTGSRILASSSASITFSSRMISRTGRFSFKALLAMSAAL